MYLSMYNTAIFKRSKAGLNSEFLLLKSDYLISQKEFSLPYYLLIAKTREHMV